MLVEHPSLLRSPVVCVDAIVDPGGATRQWRPMLYQFSEEPSPKLIYDPAPRSLEILIETVKDFYKAIAADPQRVGRALECFMRFWDILAPAGFHRQHFTIAARWDHWEREKMSWPERAADLEKQGVSFNCDAVKNVDSLKKRCRRTLKLKSGTS
jgi:hypothetical protein